MTGAPGVLTPEVYSVPGHTTPYDHNLRSRTVQELITHFDSKLTSVTHADGTQLDQLDNWRTTLTASPTSDQSRTGTATGTQRLTPRQHGYTSRGRTARGLTAPTDVTDAGCTTHIRTGVQTYAAPDTATADSGTTLSGTWTASSYNTHYIF